MSNPYLDNGIFWTIFYTDPKSECNFFLECRLSQSRKSRIIQKIFIHIWKWSFYLRFRKQFKNWNNIQSNTKEKIPLLLEFQLRWIRSRINDHAQCFKGNLTFSTLWNVLNKCLHLLDFRISIFFESRVSIREMFWNRMFIGFIVRI